MCVGERAFEAIRLATERHYRKREKSGDVFDAVFESENLGLKLGAIVYGEQNRETARAPGVFLSPSRASLSSSIPVCFPHSHV